MVTVLWRVLSAEIIDMLHKHLCFAPTRIRPIAGGTGMYVRLWGDLSEFSPEIELVGSGRSTVSFPPRLMKVMG